MGGISKLPAWAQQHIAGLNTNISSLERRLEKLLARYQHTAKQLESAMQALEKIARDNDEGVIAPCWVAKEALNAIVPE